MTDRPTTPYLTVNLTTVKQAYDKLKAALPTATIYYAVKSNPHSEVAAYVHAIGGSFEVASATEMDDLVRLGIQAEDMLFTNPVKMPEHIRRAKEAGIWRFSFDSEAELQKLATYAPGASVIVRMQAPAFDSTVPSEGKFGVDADTARKLMLDAKARGLRPYGIAFHVGSQMETPKAWRPAIQQAAILMQQLYDDGVRLHMLDIGGGFPAYYGAELPDISEYGAYIMEAVGEYLPYDVQIVTEPGRYLVANAGTLTSTVIGLAKRGQKHWLHLDVGAFNGVMEALETQNSLHFPVSDSRDSADKQLYHLTGPSCDSQDTILFDVPLSKDLDVGDQIFIHSAGAYTTCYASTFNGFSIPETIVSEAAAVPRAEDESRIPMPAFEEQLKVNSLPA
jgi:ornithine decarboxylase